MNAYALLTKYWLFALAFILASSFLFYTCRNKPMFNAADYFDGQARQLALALQANNLSAAQRLVVGVDLKGFYRQNMSFIMWCIINQRKQALTWVLQQGADPNRHDAEGTSPVGYAATLSDSDYLRVLLDHGGNPNLKDDGQPATIAAALVDEDLWQNVLLLLDRGADINAIDERGQNLIMTYAGVNDFEKVDYLITRGADIHAKKNNGGTLAFRVQDAHPNPDTKNYKWQQIVKQRLISRGIQFPVPNPWEQRKATDSTQDEN